MCIRDRPCAIYLGSVEWECFGYCCWVLTIPSIVSFLRPLLMGTLNTQHLVQLTFTCDSCKKWGNMDDRNILAEKNKEWKKFVQN